MLRMFVSKNTELLYTPMSVHLYLISYSTLHVIEMGRLKLRWVSPLFRNFSKISLFLVHENVEDYGAALDILKNRVPFAIMNREKRIIHAQKFFHAQKFSELRDSPKIHECTLINVDNNRVLLPF